MFGYIICIFAFCSLEILWHTKMALLFHSMFSVEKEPLVRDDLIVGSVCTIIFFFCERIYPLESVKVGEAHVSII